MKNTKKYYVVGILLLFFGLAIFPSINAESNKMYTPQLDISNEVKKEITLYKIDTDGRITPVDVDIALEKGQDLETIIAEKCKELCENDGEIQQSIAIKEGYPKWIEIESNGKGFHWALRRIRLANRTVIWRTMIKYRYFFKEDYTNIRFNESGEWIPLLKGPQIIRLIGFTGYVNFKPRIFWGSTIIHGYALSVEWATPRWPKY